MTWQSYAAAMGRLVDAGVLDRREADAAIAENRRIDECIDAYRCPGCGGEMTRTRDARQDGPTEVAGVWFRYRCVASCGGAGYMTDRCEPVGEN